ncbi:unnamed protein product [Aphis gossypii]|uniref:ATP-dependent DNA helicase n=1 Tax=Aphis gossypii TaxID=80765 RepID=A0A9P0J0B9_APHGO|nr:unnamed protein product [Aphis gossypii]
MLGKNKKLQKTEERAFTRLEAVEKRRKRAYGEIEQARRTVDSKIICSTSSDSDSDTGENISNKSKELRLQVKALHKNVIDVIVITGSARGDIVLIPRIPMIPTDYPFELKRIQFPLEVCFAMTINKSQGQSLSMTGIDLRVECFSHGQFYITCSRVSSASSLVILAPKGSTKNTVYKELLR